MIVRPRTSLATNRHLHRSLVWPCWGLDEDPVLGWNPLGNLNEELPDLMDPVGRPLFEEGVSGMLVAQATLGAMKELAPALGIRVHVDQQGCEFNQFTNRLGRGTPQLKQGAVFPSADRFLADAT